MTSKQGNLKSSTGPNPKDPIEILYNRRLAVRYQKRQLINVRLGEFSERLILIHGLTMFLVSLTLIGIQIGIFIQKTKLYYTASGFWMGLIFMLSSFALILLSKLKKNLSLKLNKFNNFEILYNFFLNLF